RAIATVAGNTYDHVVFVLATLLEGLSLCPINPEDDPMRIKAKCEQLTTALSVWADKPDALKAAGVETNALQGSWEGYAPAVIDTKRGSDPFIMVFTSGSTGYSKIVEQSEYSVLVDSEALILHHSLSEKTVLGTPLPIFHVNALQFGLLTVLLVGGR